MALRPRFVIIHHSATADGKTFSWDAIRQYHIKERGWVDVGYHIGVELIGERYEALFGRMLDEEGAHCKEGGMNQLGIGVCLVGNFDVDPPSDAALEKLREVVRWAMRQFEIPSRNVLGHREVGFRAGYDWQKGQYKSCPGKMFDMQEFRDSL